MLHKWYVFLHIHYFYFMKVSSRPAPLTWMFRRNYDSYNTALASSFTSFCTGTCNIHMTHERTGICQVPKYPQMYPQKKYSPQYTGAASTTCHHLPSPSSFQPLLALPDTAPVVFVPYLLASVALFPDFGQSITRRKDFSMTDKNKQYFFLQFQFLIPCFEVFVFSPQHLEL